MSQANVPSPSSGHSFIKGVLDLWEELKDIPGAMKAIAKLVGKAADAGTTHLDVLQAKGEAKAAAIRDRTKTHSVISDALTQAAAQRLSADPTIADRALAAWADEWITKQVNREAVAVKTIEHLKDE